jgi:hypothetical protein
MKLLLRSAPARPCHRPSYPTLPSRRRILAAAGTALLAPSVALAQESGGVYRIGVLSPLVGDKAADSLAMREELAKAGFVEGKNLEQDSISLNRK